MTRVRLVSFLALLLLAVFTFPAAAQEATPEAAALPLTQTFTSANHAFTLQYPDGWLTDSLGGFAVSLSDSQEGINSHFGETIPSGHVQMIIGAGQSSDLLGAVAVSDRETPLAALKAIIKLTTSLTFKAPEAITFGGRDAARAEYNAAGSEGFVILVSLDNDNVGALQFMAAPGETGQWKATALAVMESLQMNGVAAFDSTGEANATPEATQSTTQTYTSPDNTVTIQYPNGWVAKRLNDTMVYFADSAEGLAPQFGGTMPPGHVQILMGAGRLGDVLPNLDYPDGATALVVLQTSLTKEGSNAFHFGEPSAATFGGRDGARVSYTATGSEGFGLLADLGGGNHGVLQLMAAPGESGQWEAAALAIFESIEINGVAAFERTAEATQAVVEVTPEATASELAETYSNSDGTVTFSYPTTWIASDASLSPDMIANISVATSQQAASAAFHGSDDTLPTGAVALEIIIAPISALGSDLNLSPDASAMEFLQAEFKSAPSSGTTYGTITPLTINDHSAAQAAVYQKSTDAMIIVIKLGSGDFALVLVETPLGDLAGWQPTVLAIAESLRYQAG